MAKITKEKQVPGIKRVPTKRTINLATAGQKKTNFALAIPLIIVIIVLAGLFGKFMVADKIAAQMKASAEVSSLQRELDEKYAALDALSDSLSEDYAHYTYKDFTEEELTTADRLQVLNLIDQYILPEADVEEWSLVGNLLTMPITADTLEDINKIVDKLNTCVIVDPCSLTTATNETRDSRGNEVSGKVTAQISVYLRTQDTDLTEGGEAS